MGGLELAIEGCSSKFWCLSTFKGNAPFEGSSHLQPIVSQLPKLDDWNGSVTLSSLFDW